MADRRHLSVVPDAAEENAALIKALRQIGDRVPSQMRRVYEWGTPAAEYLFGSMNTCVARGLMPKVIEDNLDMPGLAEAYMRWLERQS